ncbi:MAG: hypothetical protein AB7T31_07085 [Gemmatimonadales bacterium]
MTPPARTTFVASLALAILGTAFEEASTQGFPADACSAFGVLVMAHGGTPEWDAAIAEAVAPLARERPTAIAYGMADPATLSGALDSLRADGVERVAVVRMFVSGASFLDQTEYLLGLSDVPPAFFIPSHGPHAGGPGGDGAAPGGPPPAIAHGLRVATHLHGMVDAEETQRIFADRALALSRDPARESVLLIAHGMGDPEENDELLAAMGGIEREVAKTAFHSVRSATLREDWPPARQVAEREIRAFVEGENQAGRRVLVLPVRLSGFGPYAEVLAGLEYTAGEALLPHADASRWLRRAADSIARAEGWVGAPDEASCMAASVD